MGKSWKDGHESYVTPQFDLWRENKKPSAVPNSRGPIFFPPFRLINIKLRFFFFFFNKYMDHSYTNP